MSGGVCEIFGLSTMTSSTGEKEGEKKWGLNITGRDRWTLVKYTFYVNLDEVVIIHNEICGQSYFGKDHHYRTKRLDGN